MLLQEMKTSTSDVMKSEIQTLLEKAEGEIRYYKEKVNKCQSDANSYGDRIGLLKKEGEYENATNTTITTWMVIFVTTFVSFASTEHKLNIV